MSRYSTKAMILRMRGWGGWFDLPEQHRYLRQAVVRDQCGPLGVVVFRKIKKLLVRQQKPNDVVQQIETMIQENIDKIDFDNPSERVGVRMYFTLRKQFELIGKPEGEFPFSPPFSGPKARGALLGTAIALVRQEFGSAPNKAVMDAAITAFSLAFGPELGGRAALDTIEEAGSGNDEILNASDWAIKDLTEGASDDSDAFYLAVADMI